MRPVVYFPCLARPGGDSLVLFVYTFTRLVHSVIVSMSRFLKKHEFGECICNSFLYPQLWLMSRTSRE